MAHWYNILMEVWGRRPPQANTFLGGAGEDYPTAADFATAMTIPFISIQNYRVDENFNISCRIDVPYSLNGSALSRYWNGNSKFRDYYVDVDGNMTGAATRAMASNPSLRLLFPGLTNWSSQFNGHTQTGPLLVYVPEVSTYDNYVFHNWRSGFGRVYIPKLIVDYDDTNVFSSYQLNNSSQYKNTIYIHPDMYNHPRIIHARTKSGVKADVRIVDNLDCPNAITDLTAPVTNDDGLIKTSPNGWDAEATAEEMFTGDTEASIEALEFGTARVIGLNEVENTGFDTFDYSVRFHSNGGIAVKEGTNDITNITTYAIGDIISIQRNGTVITYRKNGATIHTSTIPAPTTDMYVRAMAFTNGATVFNAKIGADPIIWKNLVNFHYDVWRVTLNFTTPAPSTNPIDYYEVWLEEIGDFQPMNRFFPQLQEITASGQKIRGLKANTQYQIRLSTVDTKFNGTGMDKDHSRRRFSNTVFFQTLPL